MTLEDKETIQFILDDCKSLIDLRWKLSKYVKNGDVSFLGKDKSKLNKRIEDLKDKDKVSAKISK